MYLYTEIKIILNQLNKFDKEINRNQVTTYNLLNAYLINMKTYSKHIV